jgi:uncharacterized protein (DUF736 family)
MMQYDPNLKGVLFRNDKGGNEKRPDYRGSAVINNVDYNISAWIKASKKTGDKFLSLTFQQKEQAKPVAKQEPAWDDMDAPF